MGGAKLTAEVRMYVCAYITTKGFKVPGSSSPASADMRESIARSTGMITIYERLHLGCLGTMKKLYATMYKCKLMEEDTDRSQYSR